MARITMLPHVASAAVGTEPQQTAAQWFVNEMARLGLPNIELFCRMKAAGFTGNSPNIISLWRSGACAISLKALPALLEALGIGADQSRLWVRHFTYGQYPGLGVLLAEAA